MLPAVQQYVHVNISGNMLCHDLVVAVWKRNNHAFRVERRPRSREEVEALSSYLSHNSRERLNAVRYHIEVKQCDGICLVSPVDLS